MAVATMAGIPYKAAIDALGSLLNTGQVVRFGRKYSATWALATAPAARRPDPLAPVEAAWRAPAPTPAPRGEAKAGPPVARGYIGQTPKNFSAIEKPKIFSAPPYEKVIRPFNCAISKPGKSRTHVRRLP